MTDTPKPCIDQFFDSDGNPVSLDTLCRREPGWAANRIRTERADLAKAHAEIDRLRSIASAAMMECDILALERRLAKMKDAGVELGEALTEALQRGDAAIARARELEARGSDGPMSFVVESSNNDDVATFYSIHGLWTEDFNRAKRMTRREAQDFVAKHCGDVREVK